MKTMKGNDDYIRHLANLTEHAANCIISTDANGVITSINRAGERMFGYTAGELIGRPASILQSELVPEDLRRRLKEFADRGESWEAESLGRRKNGEVFPIWLATSYLRDDGGNIKGAVGISRDMTRFKEYEEKLRYMAELVESAAHCIISTDANGVITSINRAGERMFGYGTGELVGRQVSALWAPETPHGTRERLAELAGKGESWEAETLGRRKNGDVFPIWLATSYLRDDRGNIKGAVGISRDMTRFKEYEEKLRYMAELVESAAHCIISTDARGIITSINRAGERMFGYDAGELPGKPVSVLWAPETPRGTRKRLAELAGKGESWEAETLGRRKNGEVFPIWLATSYLRDDRGRIKGAVGISRDLTRFKEYEEKLRYMAELVESAAHCIISTDESGVIMSINRAGERMFGYTAGELIGQHISILHSERNNPSLLRSLREKSAKGENWEGEILDRRKDGTLFPIWLSVSYLFDASGRRKGGISIIRDITEQKHAEEKIRYMADLVERASLGIISTDPGNRIVSINKAGEEMYGYRAEELLGKPISMFYSDRNPADLLERIRQKADDLQPWSAELYRRRKDGTDFISWLSTGYLFDETGKLTAKVCIERDVTEQRETEKRLAEAQHLAGLGELAAGVAHEIRNPLGGILTSVKMLLEQQGQVIGTDEMSLLGIIEKEAARLEGIVTDFLRFGRPQEPICSPVDVNRLMREIIDSFTREKVVTDTIQITVDLSEEPLTALLDENQIRQVFLNLVINASQAMGGSGELRLRTEREGNSAAIVFRDSGCGIPAADLRNIFRPFFSRKKGGTGLGLAIVNRIINAHHGSISCQSEPGGGTTFVITFPLAKEGADGIRPDRG
ncbi:MAG: PAS domain S-box protein [bacterium]|nr:PAS domain S-box protein [bacterium]